MARLAAARSLVPYWPGTKSEVTALWLNIGYSIGPVPNLISKNIPNPSQRQIVTPRLGLQQLIKLCMHALPTSDLPRSIRILVTAAISSPTIDQRLLQ